MYYRIFFIYPFKNEDSLTTCRNLDITIEELRTILTVTKRGERNVGQKAIAGLSVSQKESLSQKLVEGTAFEFVESNKRIYPNQMAAHVLGFTGAIQAHHMEADTAGYYRKQDFSPPPSEKKK